MKCQLLIMEQKLPELLDLSTDEQVQRLKQMIEHFNYIETSIIEAGEGPEPTKVKEPEKGLKTEQQRRILVASLQQWQKDERIKLLNYYKGLPVQAISKVMNVTGGMKPIISVQTSNELERVLAISERQQVLAPDSEDAVYIDMEALSVTGDNITFYVKGISPIERRKYIRLEPPSSTSINLYRNKKSVGRGELLDFSLTHISLSMPYSDTHPFKENEIFDFQFQMEQSNINGSGWIRATRKNSDQLIICIEAMADAGLQRQLQQEAASIQRKIIQEIRRKFTSAS
ncbi:MAG: hypothetical protein R8K54_08310 [Mariprofundaceae bacterium]